MEVLYNDKWIICVKKPSGIPVQPDKTKDISLLDKIEKYIKFKPYLINRIDRPASGIVIFAKNKNAARSFSKVIQAPITTKIYYAITENRLPEEKGRLEDYLIKRNNKAYITEDTKKGKKAILEYELIGTGTNYSFYKIILQTGRFHQIRAQLANKGCFIKGDVKYGARRSNKDRSIDLLAFSLTFYHPFKKSHITVQSSLPDNNIWKSLKEQY
ncbi:MAG TPA: RluA family pseudouridine synthase [Bacteroidetes bacterium]|nr:RluA family pseudouridine synthase [Bacteroidota bacterium]